MKAELHTHTYYSKEKEKVYYDGVESPELMVKHAVKNGIDAIAITDHDTMDGIKRATIEAKKHNIKIIPGEEITTKQGHLLAINIQEPIQKNIDLHDAIDMIHQQGGIAISSHPFDILREGLGQNAKHCDAMESFNPLNLDRIANIKAKRFAKKHNIPVVTGSDAHYTEMLNHGVIEANTNSIEGLLNAIKNNRLTLHKKYFSMDIMSEIAKRRFSMSYDYTMKYIDKNYSWPKRIVGKRLLKACVKGEHNKTMKTLSYVALGSVMLYSGFQTVMEL